MTTSDFLKRNVQTPLRDTFTVAGATSEIWTNSESILAVAQECFPPPPKKDSLFRLRFRFWVDPAGTSQPPWPPPYFRGLGHLVFGGFDSESSVMVDLAAQRIVGRFSPSLAADRDYWKKVIFPRVITAIGPAIGVTELHCACLEWKGSGLVLFGAPGAGKSTLSLALALHGFSWLSEDWTYFSRDDSGVVAWGLPTGVKLLPDAVRHFPELSNFPRSISLNREEAYQIRPERDFGVSLAHSCRPKWLLFLERGEEPAFDISPLSSTEAEERLCHDLLAQSPEVRSWQTETVRKLVQPGCWRLRYGGSAKEVASSLADFCLSTAPLAERAAD